MLLECYIRRGFMRLYEVIGPIKPTEIFIWSRKLSFDMLCIYPIKIYVINRI